jgi:phosphinothricin acetyltransferase
MNNATSIILRPAAESDLPAINYIYNHYVLHSTCTWQEEPEPLDGRREWFRHHSPKHPVIVAVASGQVVGWGSLSPFRERSAYRNTVENSVYVHHQHHRRGIGSALLQDLIARAGVLGCHAIIGVIDADQTASIALHLKYGFQKVGHLKQVGLKFNRWLDVIYMELILQR